MTFWFLVIGLAVACAAILGLVLSRGRIGDAPPAAYDLQVYRDQLKEVDRDLARGLVSEDDAERIRAEVSRRILAADAQLRDSGADGPQPALGGRILAVVAVVGVVAGSALLYRQMGAPGYDDFPLAARLAASDEARANRLTQDQIEATRPATQSPQDVDPNYLALMTQLRDAVAERPDDLQGNMLLARNEAALGNLTAARTAQAKVIALKGPEATAEDYAELADMMISAAGGYVSSDAEAALRNALSRNPAEPRARYYMGLYMIQIDRLDAAFRTWDTLLRESTADAPWVPLIRSQIEELAWRAGETRYQLPPEDAAPGPDPSDIEAAQQMTLAEREVMIRGMVEGLAARIEDEGGTVEEWARLSNAYAVLGDYDAVRDLLARAPGHFSDPLDLELIENAAKQAGFSE
ncbi:MAG: c-type cytochrome biogenesis protein CcmI [Pseudomonadota bacterium]